MEYKEGTLSQLSHLVATNMTIPSQTTNTSDITNQS